MANDGYWSTPMLTGSTNANFSGDTVFSCLSVTSCFAANQTADDVAPHNAYQCGVGHGGPLCAECTEGFYFQSTECLPCDASTAAPAGAAADLQRSTAKGTKQSDRVTTKRQKWSCQYV